jgi:hypothetical protein
MPNQRRSREHTQRRATPRAINHCIKPQAPLDLDTAIPALRRERLIPDPLTDADVWQLLGDQSD